MNSEDILSIIRQNRKRLAQLGVQRISLFGSQARGEARPDSDLDFLVQFAAGQKNYDNFIEVHFLLEELFHRKIDLLTEESLNPHLKEGILRDVRHEIIH